MKRTSKAVLKKAGWDAGQRLVDLERGGVNKVEEFQESKRIKL